MWSVWQKASRALDFKSIEVVSCPPPLAAKTSVFGCVWRAATAGLASKFFGSLELVADLERVSRDHSLQTLLSRLTRAYAARQALDSLQHCPGAIGDSSLV